MISEIKVSFNSIFQSYLKQIQVIRLKRNSLLINNWIILINLLKIEFFVLFLKKHFLKDIEPHTGAHQK